MALRNNYMVNAEGFITAFLAVAPTQSACQIPDLRIAFFARWAEQRHQSHRSGKSRTQDPKSRNAKSCNAKSRNATSQSQVP